MTGLGILPLAVDRDDPGREIQGPMADSEETDTRAELQVASVRFGREPQRQVCYSATDQGECGYSGRDGQKHFRGEKELTPDLFS